jgi:hypothetical protein
MNATYGLMCRAAFALAIQLLCNGVILRRMYRTSEAQRSEARA